MSLAEVHEGQNQCRRQISEWCCCYQAEQVGFDQCGGWDFCKKCYHTARKGFQQARQCVRYLWWGPVVTEGGVSPCQVD